MAYTKNEIPPGWKYFSEHGDIQVYRKGGEYMLYSSGRILLKKKIEIV